MGEERIIKESRIAEMKAALDSLVNEGNPSKCFVIFENPQTKKFVQFAFLGDELVCDIPSQELSQDEEMAIKSIMKETAVDRRTGKVISHQKWFNADEVNEASEFAETIFTKIFKLPENYIIETTLNL